MDCPQDLTWYGRLVSGNSNCFRLKRGEKERGGKKKEGKIKCKLYEIKGLFTRLADLLFCVLFFNKITRRKTQKEAEEGLVRKNRMHRKRYQEKKEA